MVKYHSYGGLAHLGERNAGSVEVIGSSPIFSTKNKKTRKYNFLVFLFLVPSIGIEPTHTVSETIALSTELQGRIYHLFLSLVGLSNKLKDFLLSLTFANL